jgi:hypothetical protein
LALEGGVGKPNDAGAGELGEPEETGAGAGDCDGMAVGAAPPPPLTGVLLLEDVPVLAPHPKVPMTRQVTIDHNMLNRFVLFVWTPICNYRVLNSSDSPDYSTQPSKNIKCLT